LCEKDVVDVKAGDAVGGAVLAEVVVGAWDGTTATVGSGSFAVVRMKRGDPRYQPIATSRIAAAIAAARMAGRISQVSG
jgi:hypothetical protein